MADKDNNPAFNVMVIVVGIFALMTVCYAALTSGVQPIDDDLVPFEACPCTSPFNPCCYEPH